ncbi:MAG: TylF/MycF/NovP-related O-methyltransferase [Bacteroidota bacterium]|nr:TylF/MycF/NovP-related O-methyltransferase [Bacteroidota bacterium]MDP4235078.1 TylF/MycF/NovP-related O-methyltransferase [Bacteroidota bacterium]
MLKKIERFVNLFTSLKVQKVKTVRGIPDAQFYKPYFSPWLGYGEFKPFVEAAEKYTLVTADRCYVLYCLGKQALQLGGEFWECGVYKGGTAILLAKVIAEYGKQTGTKLHLFDTFEGMPDVNAQKDWHKSGDFKDTSEEAVGARVGHPEHVVTHKGFIPDTFKGLENSKISFAHIDVDIYQSILDSLNFIYPRLVAGGFIVFDDYGFPTCPGARQAVDEFFAGKPEQVLAMPSGQAVVFKSR